MTDSTNIKVYTEEELAQHIKEALDNAIHARLETDIKEIKVELVKLIVKPLMLMPLLPERLNAPVLPCNEVTPLFVIVIVLALVPILMPVPPFMLITPLMPFIVVLIGIDQAILTTYCTAYCFSVIVYNYSNIKSRRIVTAVAEIYLQFFVR